MNSHPIRHLSNYLARSAPSSAAPVEGRRVETAWPTQVRSGLPKIDLSAGGGEKAGSGPHTRSDANDQRARAPAHCLSFRERALLFTYDVRMRPFAERKATVEVRHMAVIRSAKGRSSRWMSVRYLPHVCSFLCSLPDGCAPCAPHGDSTPIVEAKATNHDHPTAGLASIIVPCWGQLQFTRQCIPALRPHERAVGAHNGCVVRCSSGHSGATRKSRQDQEMWMSGVFQRRLPLCGCASTIRSNSGQPRCTVRLPELSYPKMTLEPRRYFSALRFCPLAFDGVLIDNRNMKTVLPRSIKHA